MYKQLLFLLFFLFIQSIPFAAFAFDPEEIHAGYFADQYMVKTEVLLFNDTVTKRIEKIGHRVARGAAIDYPEASNVKFTFRIINSPEINASATAGGFIYVNTGLLDFAKSEDEIAAVIAHEMVHTLRSHYLKKLKALDRNKKILNASVYVIGVFSGAVMGAVLTSSNSSPGTRLGIGLGALGGGLAVAKAGTVISKYVAEGYGQKQELDADKDGMRFLSNSGYNPRSMIGLFKRMSYLEKKMAVLQKNNYRSHLINSKPSLSVRIQQLETLIPSLAK